MRTYISVGVEGKDVVKDIASDMLLKTGWPRKNATLTINDFKKTRDRINKLCPLLRITFFF